jgi:TolB protein
MRFVRGMALLALVAMGCVTDPPVPCTACDGVCVDTQNDRRHCGGCGMACAAGRVCTAGACVAVATTCAAPLTACSGVCFDLQNDPGHCGSCTTVCGASEFCRMGTCTSVGVDAGPPSCPSGTATCDGGCFDQQNDPRNCGACGRTCNATEYCSNGACAQFPVMGLDAGTCIASTNPCEIVTFMNGACVVTQRTCPAGGACRSSGMCNPASGACEYTNVTGACDDGNACTASDVCVNGACVGTTPLACATPGACFEPVVCVPSDGGCTVAAPKAEGASCDNGDPCAGAAVCRQGRCVGSVGPTVVENFAAGASPNQAAWRSSRQDGGFVAIVSNQVQLSRNARLVTADDYLLASGPVRVTGEFTSGVASDWAHVWTRSSGLPGSGFQLDSGVEFIVKPTELEVRNNGVSLGTAAFDGGLAVGQPVVFDVFDDGASVSLTVRNKGAANETRLTLAIPDAGTAGKIVFGAGNDATPVNGASGFGLLRLEHGVRVKPTREWTFEEVSPGPMGVVVGGYGLLPDGGLAGARNARFVQNRTLNFQAASAVAPGIFGSAASFASSPAPGRFVEFPNDIIGSTGGNFSVSFWTRLPPVNGSTVVEVFGNRDEGSNGVFFSFRASPTGAASELDQNGGAAYSPIPNAGQLPAMSSVDDLWHHVVVTREGRNHQLYLDGQQAGAFDGGAVANFAKATPFWVGRGFQSTGTGSFDELRVYDSFALNACEVRRLSTRPQVSSGCAVGEALCSVAASGVPVCVDLQSDENHCGACNTPCVGGATCVQAICRGQDPLPPVVWASQLPGGGAPTADVTNPVLSRNGSFISFETTAPGFVTGDTGTSPDGFVRSLTTLSSITRILDANGNPPGTMVGLDLDPTGREVSFMSDSPNVAAGDINGSWDAFVVNLDTNARTIITRNQVGAQLSNGEPFETRFVAGGRGVIFYSRTSYAPGGSVGGEFGPYLRDRVLGTTVTAAPFGAQGGNGLNIFAFDFNENSSQLVYSTAATYPDDTTNCNDIHLSNLSTGVRRIVSRTPANVQGTCVTFADGAYTALFLGEDRILFTSTYSNLVPGDTNGGADLFIRDLAANTLTRLDLGIGGTLGNGSTEFGSGRSISADKRYLVFTSTASNLVAGDTNGVADCFEYDFVFGSVRRINLTSTGAQAPLACESPRISGDGRFATYVTRALLVPADGNSFRDVYVQRLRP